MEARHEDDRALQDAIEKPVRKPMNQSAASFAMQNRVSLRPGKNSFDGHPNLFEKFLTQSLTLRLVPSVSTFEVGRSRRPEDVIPHRERARI
jgi:hypothetical protein